MLQQTQVSTVRAYYLKFIARFPDVHALSDAEEDDVLGLWSGLGYYSRARNLHRCARLVVRGHGGRFPETAIELQTLPGIGRSTAAAIAAFCFNERVAIFDANVKRVLSRLLAFSGDLSMKASEDQLWNHATALLPASTHPHAMSRYTQGVMDLGATVCTARRPACVVCPVRQLCVASSEGAPEIYPVKTRKVKRGTQKLSLLWMEIDDGRLWLEKRPSSGIWGGLHCFPTFENDDALQVSFPRGLRPLLGRLPGFVHILTHKTLQISAWRVVLSDTTEISKVPKYLGTSGAWHVKGEWIKLGLPAPIRKLLEGAR